MMFDGPEYASYIALCRDLRLEREFKLGDWVHYLDDAQGYDSVDCICFDDNRDPDRTGPGIYWLPRLDQWLAMLEEAGYGSVTIERSKRFDAYHAFVPATTEEHGGRAEVIVRDGHFVTLVSDNAPSREEAAARLWMAVTGR